MQIREIYGDSNTSNADLLNTVYQNSKTGIDSIDYILPRIKNSNLKKDLASQMAGYFKFINRVSSKFDDIDESPSDLFILSRIPSMAYMKLKVYVDDSESHLAEVIIENSTSGLIEAQKIYNRCRNLDCEISQIGCEAIYFEQKSINRLRNYL
ncbi:MAG: hypothetical protein FWH10_00295 [Oscillospiraceae bacterium]|nr:hypothetical protein [Oscillospiraceae bacterium]